MSERHLGLFPAVYQYQLFLMSPKSPDWLVFKNSDLSLSKGRLHLKGFSRGEIDRLQINTKFIL